MTPQEHQALQLLLSQLTQIREIPKDAEAERLINEAMAKQPDAAYLLVQRTMLLEQALESAKAQIARLEAQAAPAPAGASFLDANAWGNVGTQNGAGTTSVTGRPLADNMPQLRAMPAPGFGRVGNSGFLGGGSMLGTLAATAAGVAGGAFLFQGIGNLLDQHRAQEAGAKEAGAKEAASGAEHDAGQTDATTDQWPLADNLFEDNNFSDDSGSSDGI
jgi:hypothetical protein